MAAPSAKMLGVLGQQSTDGLGGANIFFVVRLVSRIMSSRARLLTLEYRPRCSAYH
jgi:hypothetical protein